MDNPNKDYEERKRRLIDFLCDVEDDDIGGRDDAAMYLAEFDDDEVIEALVKVGSNPEEDIIILNSCGTSLGGIWLARDCFDEKLYNQLAPYAKQGFYERVSYYKPEWGELYNIDNLDG